MAIITELPRLLTASEAAKALRVTRATLYALIDRGDLHASRLGTGPRAHIRIDSRELARFLEQPARQAA